MDHRQVLVNAAEDSGDDMDSLSRRFAVLGSISAFLAVGIGAFAAHALRDVLSHEGLRVFEIGGRYHLVHALALLAVAVLNDRLQHRAVGFAGWLFLWGTVLFSGSLYALAITGHKWLGAVTPLGGLLFLAGWAALAWGALRSGTE